VSVYLKWSPQPAGRGDGCTVYTERVLSAVDCSAVSVSDDQELFGQDAATQQLHSTDAVDWHRSMMLYTCIHFLATTFSERGSVDRPPRGVLLVVAATTTFV